ncbi:protein tyrosine phosphatase domain-containing protein 1 isoform X2 [Camarhynchus parvulus]|uniref:protein tyrosine phosphatase domain-containing protein 1 isoform X2 n=1 Tax=Geospiza parvula TaxID=87175 RepID=UPI0012382AB9|nr:protein tyrosine phosphatase domain-containing protein 1 isoform X2 [Camarhynchus parvulus]
MPVIEQELNTPIVYYKHFGCSQRVLKITYLTSNYFHQAVEQFVPSRRNPCGKEQPGAGWQQRLHPPLPWRQLSPGTSCRARSGMLRSAPATSALSNFPCAQSAPGSGAGRSWGRAAMQPSPRRRSAVSIFSYFFQGRRHSSSDPLLRLSQRRRSSVVELLSSSTHRVMVALSSLSPEELDATFPEKKRSSRRPTAKYTKMGERLRHVIPGHMQCSMACGGRACKITDNILAMARPSTELIEKYNIIEQFERCGIKTIINLQRPGEHASCGNPLEQESGFTYRPEAFMEAGIYFYNFGWKDYGVASLTTILDMVKVMSFALQEGRVAVHCHAGLGRTGVLIACYLVFATRMSADQAILFVRAKRPNSIQTRGQLLCVREFSQFLVPLRNVFACCEPKAHAVTLSQYLTRQRHLLHGYESRHLKHVPKLIHLVCKLLLDLAENRQVVEAELLDIPDLSAEIEKTVSQLASTELERELARHDSDTSDSSYAPSSTLDSQDSHVSLGHECDAFCRRRHVECLQPLTHMRRRLSYSESDLRRTEFLLEQDDTAWTVPAQILVNNKLKQNSGEECSATGEAKPQLELNKEALVRNTCTFWNQGKFDLDGRRDGSCHRRSSTKEVHRSRTFSSGLASMHNPKEPGMQRHSFASETAPRKDHKTNIYGRRFYLSEDSDSSSSSSKVNFSIGNESESSRELSETIPHIVLQSELSLEARRVLAAKALADINEFLGEDEVKQKVEMWQKELNSQDGAWDKICSERDPFILCSLMWSWIEQLKEPIISKDDIDMLAKHCTESQDALHLLGKEQCQTILCILHCVVKLQVLPADVEEALLARAIKAFTKISFDSENGPYVYNTLKTVFKQALEEKRKRIKEGTENPS